MFHVVVLQMAMSFGGGASEMHTTPWARLVGHVVGSCIMVAPAYASDTSGLDFQQFVEEFAGKKDFFVALASATLSVAGTAVAVAQLDQAKRSADEAKRSADEALKSSPEGKIQQALAKAMEPLQAARRGHPKASDGSSPATHCELATTCDHHWGSVPVRQVCGNRRSLARGARCCAIHHQKCRLDRSDAITWELMTKGCSKRSCAERARSSRTFPTTSPSFQSCFLKSLVQPPKDWLDEICFSVVYRCCSAFCPSPFVSVPLAEAST